MATSGGLRRGWNPGAGTVGLVAVAAIAAAGVAALDVANPWTVAAMVGGGVLVAGAVVVATARIGVPLLVRGCRGLARGYRIVRPNSPTVRRMALAVAVFLLVGSVFLGVGMLAF